MRGPVAARPVFALDGEAFSWAQVVAASRRYGSWCDLEASTRYGLACERRLAESSEELPAQDVVDAMRRFRYARGLLAGEQLEQWLEHWQLTATEWRDHVGRGLLRERWPGRREDTAERFPVSDDEVAGALWPEAVCSGELERSAVRVAADGALAVAAGETIEDDREHALVRIRSAADGARAAAITEHVVAREIASHSLDWLRVEGEMLEFAEEDVAREAALCIRVDGQRLTDVATASAIEPGTLRVYVADIEAELASMLVAAREGELVGPVPRDGRFSLMLVEKKTPATGADPEVHSRAEERIVERLVERALREHVEWHERF